MIHLKQAPETLVFLQSKLLLLPDSFHHVHIGAIFTGYVLMFQFTAAV